MAREHLSIGEVLALLQTDFPDVTISKIRFLETQGLIDPERTPSGYRKFYDADIERLRWVLTQQRDNFLPLRVIRERLASGELDGPAAASSAAAEDGSASTPAGGVDGAGSAPASPAAPAAPVSVASAPAASSTPAPGSVDAYGTGGLLDPGPSAITLTLDELSTASGLSPVELAELERYGCLSSRQLGPSTYYDGSALAVARIAAKFASFGVEPRHLRMFKTGADREASVFEQVVMPLVRQRNPAARRAAIDQLEEMAVLGARMRVAMLRQALEHHLEP